MRAMFLALLLSFSAAARADGGAALQKFLDGVQSLNGTFEQVQKDEKGNVTQSSSGQFWLQRPGKFRWSYEKPYQQLLVCNGKTIWLFDPDLAQVTVREAKPALAGTPAELLSQRAALAERFKAEDLGAEGGAQHLRLTPKSSDGDFKSIEMWLRGGVPERLRFDDPLGGSTDVKFTELKTNAPIDAAQFGFTVPKDVEIVQASEPGKK